MILIWRLWKLSNFQYPLPPFSMYVRNSSTPLTLNVHFQMYLPTPNDNQSVKWEHNSNMLLGCFFRLACVFSINSLIFSDFPLTSFHLAEGSPSAWYSCVCSCPKISRNFFHLQLFTFLVLILQSNCFIYKSWKRKLRNNNCTVHVNKRNQNKQSQLTHGFTVWRQSQKEQFLPVIYCLAQHEGDNPIFFIIHETHSY